MKKQVRQKCPQCGLSYRYKADFDEHQRVAHKPVEDTSKRSTWSDKEDGPEVSQLQVLDRALSESEVAEIFEQQQ